jgi:hypothetical protein
MIVSLAISNSCEIRGINDNNSHIRDNISSSSRARKYPARELFEISVIK